ncbi:hypothetical protein FE391_34945 [Nonomuraea sp. KC401]|uniref:hypothetical protein n=1 Tax=unclassified Nonomuraea TaxID=2593643 RepID=UPI0010FE424D|nr:MULTISPECIES: hypothetical protein [unclassified Nonomuraea]NBE98852.1 hypothetical protein [Nonomuraea sp. K271]TLF59373.1 hypothetical protein FE391_34945 [Nonomuraea sp. KC401]
MNWPTERELPEGRHRLLKEFVMTEIDKRPAKRRVPRLAVLAPALGLALAAAVSVPLLFGGTPAYAVEKRPDGLIDITLNEVKNPEQLQEDLRAAGAEVVVNYIPMGKKCSPQPRSSHFLGTEEGRLAVFPSPEPGRFTIDPRVIGEGQTGVLEFSVSENNGGVIAGIWARVGQNPIAECELVDTTDAPLSH